MKSGNKIFDHATEPWRACLRHAASRGGQRTQRILAYLEEHLFAPGLTFEAAKRACGEAGNYMNRTVAETLGEQPGAFINRCRMEVAARLLRDTDWRIDRIGACIGYAHAQGLTEAFKKRWGATPAAYRRQQRAAAHDDAKPDAAAAWRRRTALAGISQEQIERAVRDEATRSNAADFDGTLRASRVALREVYSNLDELQAAEIEQPHDKDSRASLVVIDLDGSREEEVLKAEKVVKLLETLPGGQQRQLVETARFRTPALFERLSQASQEAGERHPGRGLRYARLAWSSLESLGDETDRSDEHRSDEYGSDEHDSDEHRLLRARAHLTLGLALNRVLDLDGAMNAFDKAEAILSHAAAAAAAAWSDLWLGRATLHFYRGAVAAALEASHEAVTRSEPQGRAAARALLLRARLHRRLGASANALTDLTRVRDLLRGSPRIDLHQEIHHQLALTHYQAAMIDRARDHLRVARSLAEIDGDAASSAELSALEGWLALSHDDLDLARHHFDEARQAADDLGQTILAALVTLAIAVLEGRRNHGSLSLQLIRASLKMLAPYADHPPLCRLVDLLRQAATTVSKAQPGLDEICTQLEQLRQEPTLRLVRARQAAQLP